MKLLLDSCVWGGALEEISAAGHDVETVASWSEDPGDEKILETANHAGRILITLDKDFGELAIVRGIPHAGIIRLVGFSARQQGSVCLRVISRWAKDLTDSAIITVQHNRVRIRKDTA